MNVAVTELVGQFEEDSLYFMSGRSSRISVICLYKI